MGLFQSHLRSLHGIPGGTLIGNHALVVAGYIVTGEE